jgi:hypothetical protein
VKPAAPAKAAALKDAAFEVGTTFLNNVLSFFEQLNELIKRKEVFRGREPRGLAITSESKVR